MSAFPRLRYAELHVTLASDAELRLPADKGTSLHGLLGYALSQALCRIDGGPDCGGCWLRSGCGYGVLFGELMPDPPPRGLKGVETPPRPYVVVCADRRTTYRRGDTLHFALRLFGRAAELQGSVAIALEQLAARGFMSREYRERESDSDRVIEVGPGGFALVGLERTRRDGSCDRLLGRMRPDVPFRNELLTAPPPVPASEGLRVRFVTPAGLDATAKGWLYELVLSIRRRAEHLAAIYHGADCEASTFAALLRMAEQTPVVIREHASSLRYRSGNNGARTRPLEGAELTIDIPHCPAALRETLAWGQALHVGRHATSGLGQYVVEPLLEGERP